MVYVQQNQLARYHVNSDRFLTTNSHFYDGATQCMEAPLADTAVRPHKASTFALLYSGSERDRQLRGINDKAIKTRAGTLQACLGLRPWGCMGVAGRLPCTCTGSTRAHAPVPHAIPFLAAVPQARARNTHAAQLHVP